MRGVPQVVALLRDHVCVEQCAQLAVTRELAFKAVDAAMRIPMLGSDVVRFVFNSPGQQRVAAEKRHAAEGSGQDFVGDLLDRIAGRHHREGEECTGNHRVVLRNVGTFVGKHKVDFVLVWDVVFLPHSRRRMECFIQLNRQDDASASASDGCV